MARIKPESVEAVKAAGDMLDDDLRSAVESPLAEGQIESA